MLKQIGRPLVHSHHGYSTAVAVVATYGRLLGCRTDIHADTHQPLGPEHVLAVHSEGEPNFGVMARGYPVGFDDVNLGQWDEE